MVSLVTGSASQPWCSFGESGYVLCLREGQNALITHPVRGKSGSGPQNVRSVGFLSLSGFIPDASPPTFFLFVPQET
jgi:hypothetical protein